MNNVRPVPAIDFDRELANKSRVRARKTIKNPDASLYLSLKNKGKIESIFVFPKGRRLMNYKEWIQSKSTEQV